MKHAIKFSMHQTGIGLYVAAPGGLGGLHCSPQCS